MPRHPCSLGRALLALACAALAARPALADPSAANAPAPFEVLSLACERLDPDAASQPGPVRRTLRVWGDGRLLLEREHPYLRFDPCHGRVEPSELERLVALLPALPRERAKLELSGVAGRTAFALACQGEGPTRRALGLLEALPEGPVGELVTRLEGLARRLLNERAPTAIELRGQVVVRPLGGRFEVLVATPHGEIPLSEPLASAARPLVGHPIRVAGELVAAGSLERGELLDPRPVRLRGSALRTAQGIYLRGTRGRLEALGARRAVLAAAAGHEVAVAGWRYATGQLVIDAVGAEAKGELEARRAGLEVARHPADAPLRVLGVSATRGRALVQDTAGGRIGWVPLAGLRWSSRAPLPPAEGSESLTGQLATELAAER